MILPLTLFAHLAATCAPQVAPKTLAAAILQQQQTALQTNAATLNSLQSQALGTGGRQATLQTLAGIEATVGQQIQSQQGTLSAAVQAIMTYQTARTDRQALIDAANANDINMGLQAACQTVAASGGTSTACTGTTGVLP